MFGKYEFGNFVFVMKLNVENNQKSFLLISLTLKINALHHLKL
jgi:hypothetical protein